MSSLEVFVGIASLVLTVFCWSKWYADLVRVNPFHSLRRERLSLAVVPIVCFALISLFLCSTASSEVRRDTFWITYYALLGAAVVGVLTSGIALMGIDARTDVLERGNSAAAWVVCATPLAFTICFVGGNSGEGPGVHAVLASVGLAAAVETALWALFACLGRAPHERITVDHDNATALRLSGLVLGNAFVLGYAASGPWDARTLFGSFARAAWPALVLTGVATMSERFTISKTVSRILGVSYVLAGVVVVLYEASLV